MKKLVNILLVLAMVLGMIPTMVNAEKSYNTNDGKIIINPAKKEQVYNIYEVLQLESFDSEKNAYAYKATAEWSTFINSTGIKGIYVEVDTQGYVTWIDGASAEEFATKALAYAKANNIDATATKESENNESVEFTGLNLGYYLVDSSLGALCGLTTTAKEVTIHEKNTAGDMDKKVKIDSVNYGESNTASIGDTIEYKIEVTIGKGAETYTLTDKLDASLTLNPSSIEVTADNYDNDDFYVVDKVATNDYTFKVTIDGSKLTENAVVTVKYTAVLNENALKVNNNTATLVYGNNNNKIEKTTKTYAYEFDLIKTDSADVLLDGAEFRLYDAQTEGNEIKVFLIDEENNTYRVAYTDAEKAAAVVIKAKNGKATIFGLGNGKYYLEETKQPEGFNKLASRAEVKIDGDDLKATTEVTDNVIKYKNGGVHIVNTNGTVLPSTGGLGTTLFITIGSLVALLAAVVLVTNKRMANENI